MEERVPLVRYEVGGRSYEIKSTNGNMDFRKGKLLPISYPPAHPEEGCIDRFLEKFGPPLLFGGGGTVFAFVGLAMLSHRRDRGSDTNGPKGPARELTANVGHMMEYARVDPDRPTVPALDLSQCQGSTHAFRLPVVPPGRKLAGAMFHAFFFIGMAVLFISAAPKGGPMIVVYIISTLTALYLIGKAVWESLVTFGVGPTTVEISDHPLVPGERYGT